MHTEDTVLSFYATLTNDGEFPTDVNTYRYAQFGWNLDRQELDAFLRRQADGELFIVASISSKLDN